MKIETINGITKLTAENGLAIHMRGSEEVTRATEAWLSDYDSVDNWEEVEMPPEEDLSEDVNNI